ncbi:MAG: S9 family peptidase [Phycisphaerae bacterium]|nr:S9 family peptidase [Phycisphaerae bacterium]
MNRTRMSVCVGLLCLVCCELTFSRAEPLSPQGRTRGARGPSGYDKARVRPNWFANDTRFWYRNDLADSTREFIAVNAEEGTRAPAFDHARLAASLSAPAGKTYSPDKLPFSTIQLTDKAVEFAVDGTQWSCDLATYACTRIGDAEPDSDEATPSRATRRSAGQGRGRRSGTLTSPDGQWIALVKDYNVYVRGDGDSEDESVALSQDGTEDAAYGMVNWSPDSQAIVAYRIEPGDRKEVHLIESSPAQGGRAVLRSRPYALPGDKFSTYELNLFTLKDKTQIKPDVDKQEFGWQRPQIHWHSDNRHFTYQLNDRGHQRLRIVEVDAWTGTTRNLVDEKTETFIWTMHTENLSLNLVNWLEQTNEIIYVSEQDGWRHLYLVNGARDPIMTQITQGEYVIRGIDRIDEETRQIWFTACGMTPGEDPYFIHYYRVNFDGTGLVALTQGNGTHTIQYSPDQTYLIDTYSRVDRAPVHTLRRVSDGSLVCDLEQADISELQAKGWQAPEVFVAKGRDNKTDIWGIICRPRDFDPAKKYPVIEQIYAGPQGSYVPKSFSPYSRFSSYTDLGFIVVQMDAMGTANRSKAFHDVCWHNLKGAGFPDRILWHQAAAARYPYYDISRVGIYGTSAGAQNAAGAVLFHPEFYKVAVAACGCHDNRMDKASWNEQWMGYPVGPQYSENSNIDNAARLQGYLMLIVGELDDNVPPESTFRFCDALIKAEKDFDLVVIPGARHGSGGPHGERKRRDFFVQHLLGQEIPNHNQ